MKLVKRTEADDVVVPRAAVYDIPSPGIILDPPHEPLRAALDLADVLHPRDRTTRELKLAVLPRWLRVRVAHHHDVALAAQPSHELVLDATHERLRPGPRAAPECLSHPAHREAELPRAARFGVAGGRDGRGERDATREVLRERDGECPVRERGGGLEIALGW